MTADPRAVEVTARAICDAPDATIGTCWDNHAEEAEAVLAALSAAGWSLLPPGGQSRHPVSDLVSAAQAARDGRFRFWNARRMRYVDGAEKALSDLLAAIAEHDQADDPHEWETCFIDVRERADALASAILHTDPEGDNDADR